MDDPRFSAMHTAATFKKIRKEKYETQVDDRFKEMLTSEKFSLGPGEKKKKKAKRRESEQEDPHVDGSGNQRGESDPAGAGAAGGKRSAAKGKAPPEKKESRLDYLNRLARGEVDGSSSSEDSESEEEPADASDSSSSEGEDEDSSDEHADPLQVQQEEVGEIEEATHRLAIQNCEWNNVRADDLMVILQSFCSPGMQVKSVTIYPSDFGIERMKEEAIHGPPKELWKKKKGKDSDSSESDGDFDFDKDRPKSFEEEEFNNVALRAYELSKLRYYFAIAVLDSPRTAESLYAQLDGIEFEHSAMVFDMRFVPDDVSFSERTPRDKCTGSPSTSYKPPEFVVKALTHSNVECSWDKDEDPVRSRRLTNMSSWRNLNDSDLQQYLAGSGSEDSDAGEGEGKRRDMRHLLLGDNSDGGSEDDFFARGDEGEGGVDDEETGAMTFSFVPGEKESQNAELAKKRMEEGLETPQEAVARRKEARRALKKQKEQGGEDSKPVRSAEPATAEQLKSIMGGGGSDEDSAEDDYDMHALSKAEKKRMKKAERLAKKKSKSIANDGVDETAAAGFSVDTTDERFFSVLRNSSNYGIDPTASEFKPTEGMSKILKEQRRQRQLHEERMEEELRSSQRHADPLDADSKRKRSKIEEVTPLVDRLKKKYKSK